jgi:DtxR family Mn-dependent transcriptional regulator
MGDPIKLLGGFALLVVLSAVVFWPRRGVVAWIQRHAELTDRVLAEDILKFLFHREKKRRAVSADEIQAALEQPARRVERNLERLKERDLISQENGGYAITVHGREHALHLVRSHRLWERYLADRTGVDPDRWHEEAEKAEHRLTPQATARLAERMGQPAFDPHGDPIPTAEGVIPELEGIALTELNSGGTAEVVHIEDEPQRTYENLVAAGLAPGGMLTLSATDNGTLTIIAGGRQSTLSRMDAENVLVRPTVDAPREEVHPTLADIRPGSSAKVISISPACQGLQRRRLLDLGFVPGSVVSAEMASAMGDPIAYRVRGAVIALRRVQAEWILIERSMPGEEN